MMTPVGASIPNLDAVADFSILNQHHRPQDLITFTMPIEPGIYKIKSIAYLSMVLDIPLPREGEGKSNPTFALFDPSNCLSVLTCVEFKTDSQKV